MTEIIKLPENFIGKEDREKMESFGGHEISHGRATRWHWGEDADGDDVFEIHSGGEDEMLVSRISRDRELDTFCAHDAPGKLIVSGKLEHIMAELEQIYFDDKYRTVRYFVVHTGSWLLGNDVLIVPTVVSEVDEENSHLQGHASI